MRNILGTRIIFIAIAICLTSPSAFAQDAAGRQIQNRAPAEATTERVIVTGSYIPTAETEAALPVTVYTAEVLQKQGANTPVEGLRQLPSSSAQPRRRMIRTAAMAKPVSTSAASARTTCSSWSTGAELSSDKV